VDRPSRYVEPLAGAPPEDHPQLASADGAIREEPVLMGLQESRPPLVITPNARGSLSHTAQGV
jgi:hypothetical protein